MVSKFTPYDLKWITGWKGLPECYAKVNVPSVTKIINEIIPDPEMEEWVRKVGEEKAKEIMTNAGYKGTAMHMFIENFVKKYAETKDASKSLSFTQTESPALLIKENIPLHKIDEGREMFYKFYYSDYSNTYEKLIGTEMGIYSKSLFYRGLADVFYNNRIFGASVTDFKSSSTYIKKGSVKELKYKYQLGGYAGAIDEMYIDKNLVVKHSAILCISGNSDILQEISLNGAELEEYKEKFKTIVREWHTKYNKSYLIN